jgi:RNAse (barnase) inhibitor barstar
MKEITLDITSFEEKIPLHRYFKEMLDFPFYYGGNLDALYDELSSNTQPLDITLRYPAAPKGKMEQYVPRLLKVFEDAARENYHLKVRFETDEEMPNRE